MRSVLLSAPGSGGSSFGGGIADWFPGPLGSASCGTAGRCRRLLVQEQSVHANNPYSKLEYGLFASLYRGHTHRRIGGGLTLLSDAAPDIGDASFL